MSISPSAGLPGRQRHVVPEHGPALTLLACGWLVLGVLICASLPALAESPPTPDAPKSAPRAIASPKAVVELFTSQGCSSCPPADKLIGELAQRDDVLALTLAVDYWDYLGWKDTLAKHGHSLRQKAYARLRGDGKMFTPQTVISGKAMTIGSDKASLEGAIDTAGAMSAPVTARARDGRLVIEVGPGAGTGEIWLCPLASETTVKIGRGENEGATMTYHNVVRRWIKAGEWTGGAATFEVSLDDIRGDGIDAVAVLVQAGTQAAPGSIIGATLQPLP
ncbi:DUF1223 domain-containing protein [Bosea sp. 117]|uniref:DUF1223 domain-containing protein n=1 Tax=Bosea sp. 117 TaxID=1125973 RepID=UPI000689D686|nr:DUF1223 domain-containing protein [Bosea sp. 117]